MIGYLRRLLPVVTRAALRRDGRLISRIERRVSLDQIDLNLHMNQAAYAEVMELGRTDWVIRSRAWARWRELGVKPVVADQHIVYRREMKLHQAYTLDSRALGMKGRLLHLQTFILVGDRVHARNDLNLIFIGPEGVLSAEHAASLCEGVMADPVEVIDWQVAR